MGQTKPGQRTVGGCAPDPRLGQSSEGDLGHSTCQRNKIRQKIKKFEVQINGTTMINYIQVDILHGPV